MLLRIETFEGVIEMTVVAAQLELLFHDVGFKSLIGQGQGRRDAGKPAADDQHGVIDGELTRLQGLQILGFGDGHADKILGLFRRRFGFVHMDPGVLVADVGHLKEITVQTGLLAVLLEKPFVGAGRAGGDDHAGQFVLLDHFAHLDGRILGTGEEVVRCIDDIGQGLGVFHDRGHIHDAADVNAAMANKDARPRADAPDVVLQRHFFLAGQRSPTGSEKSLGAGCGAAGFHDCFRDILGSAEGAADKDAFPRGLDGILQSGLAEAVLLKLHAEGFGQFSGLLRRRQTDGQDDHVEFLLHKRAVFLNVFDEQIFRLLEFLDGRRHGPDIADAVFPLGAVHKAVEILAVGADIHEENRGFQVLGVFLADDRLLRGVHAADR